MKDSNLTDDNTLGCKPPPMGLILVLETVSGLRRDYEPHIGKLQLVRT